MILFRSKQNFEVLASGFRKTLPQRLLLPHGQNKCGIHVSCKLAKTAPFLRNSKFLSLPTSLKRNYSSFCFLDLDPSPRVHRISCEMKWQKNIISIEAFQTNKVKNPGDGTTWYRVRASTCINQENCLDYNALQKIPPFCYLKVHFFSSISISTWYLSRAWFCTNLMLWQCFQWTQKPLIEPLSAS